MADRYAEPLCPLRRRQQFPEAVLARLLRLRSGFVSSPGLAALVAMPPQITVNPMLVTQSTPLGSHWDELKGACAAESPKI